MKRKTLALLLCAALLLTACTAAPTPTTQPVENSTPVENPTAPTDPNLIAYGDIEFRVLPGMRLAERGDGYSIVELVPGQAQAMVFAVDVADMDALTLAGAADLFKMKFADLNMIHYAEMSTDLRILNNNVTFDYYATNIGGNALRYNLLGTFSDTYTLYVVKYSCVDGEMPIDECSAVFGRFLSGATGSSNSPRFEIVFDENSATVARASLISNSSTGESNAAKKAQQYLSISAFSYTGLIDQLKYEGFTDEEAAFGANVCGADWYEQATIKAAAYLDLAAFSKSGLIEQLEYEGFTHEQAVYGAEQNGY